MAEDRVADGAPSPRRRHAHRTRPGAARDRPDQRPSVGVGHRAFHRAADIFVLPSHAEGMSNALLEAMAVGLPPIATRVGAAESMIEDGVSGILVDVGDRDAMEDFFNDLSMMSGCDADWVPQPLRLSERDTAYRPSWTRSNVHIARSSARDDRLHGGHVVELWNDRRLPDPVRTRVGTGAQASAFFIALVTAISLGSILSGTVHVIALPRLTTTDGGLHRGPLKLMAGAGIIAAILAVVTIVFADRLTFVISGGQDETANLIRAAGAFLVARVVASLVATVALARDHRFAPAAAPSVPSIVAAAYLIASPATASASSTLGFLALGSVAEIAILALLVAGRIRTVPGGLGEVRVLTLATMAQLGLLVALAAAPAHHVERGFGTWCCDSPIRLARATGRAAVARRRARRGSIRRLESIDESHGDRGEACADHRGRGLAPRLRWCDGGGRRADDRSSSVSAGQFQRERHTGCGNRSFDSVWSDFWLRARR